MRFALALALVLSSCVTDGTETAIERCGPAPLRPGIPISSDAGRVSMDSTTWSSLSAWIAALESWQSCVEGN